MNTTGIRRARTMLAAAGLAAAAMGWLPTPAGAAPATDAPGTTDPGADPAIIDGNEASPGEYPWAVRLLGGCSGSLIRSDLVLTAAHCVDDIVAGDEVAVEIGRTDLSDPFETFERRRTPSIVLHPDWDEDTFENDVALLRLREPVNVPTVAVATSAPAPGTDARIIGYGRTGPDDPAATELREGDSEVIADTAADSPIRSRTRAERDVMVVLDGESGTCRGDSGGPALVRVDDRWVQFGVNSWTPGGSDDCRPDVFTDLTSDGVSAWLQSHLGQPVGYGDFDGDGRQDVFRANGDAWQVSSDGGVTFELVNTSGVQVPDLAFGDFDGDGRDDVFYGNGAEWKISWGGTSRWQVVNTSGYRSADVGLGDFDGDGTTDVFKANGHTWSVSYGATTRWTQINTSAARTPDLAFGDFDGDGRDDVYRHRLGAPRLSSGGTGRWQELVA
jgi:hypothetical protein